MKGALQGINGGRSSKRLAGFISLTGYIIISMYAVYHDPSQASSVLIPLAGIIIACFGATVFEKKQNKEGE